MTKILRVKGSRRTGNNFLIATLRSNLNVKVDTGGGSHTLIKMPPNNDHTVYFIITIKNPYAWCVSITNWAKSSWGPQWSKYSWDKNWNKWEKLYKRYNDFYRVSWKFYENYSEDSLILPYEEFLADTEGKINFISRTCNLKRKSKDIIIPTKVPQSSEFTAKRKKFYLKSTQYGLNGEVIKKINNCIDWELMAKYGYERLK